MREQTNIEESRPQTEENLCERREAAVPVSKTAEAVEDAETVMQFPMLFPIKVMGLASEDFKKTVEGIAKAHFEDFNGDSTEVEYSRTRKYMSVTVTVNARSREQLDDAYRTFTANPQVKIVL